GLKTARSASPTRSNVSANAGSGPPDRHAASASQRLAAGAPATGSRRATGVPLDRITRNPRCSLLLGLPRRAPSLRKRRVLTPWPPLPSGEGERGVGMWFPLSASRRGGQGVRTKGMAERGSGGEDKRHGGEVVRRWGPNPPRSGATGGCRREGTKERGRGERATRGT